MHAGAGVCVAGALVQRGGAGVIRQLSSSSDFGLGVQGQACAWLGHWYNEVAQEYSKARNCYAQALQLEPSSSVIGELPICRIMVWGSGVPLCHH